MNDNQQKVSVTDIHQQLAKIEGALLSGSEEDIRNQRIQLEALISAAPQEVVTACQATPRPSVSDVIEVAVTVVETARKVADMLRWIKRSARA